MNKVKLLLPTILLLAICGIGFAQEVSIGVEVGYNAIDADMTDNDYIRTKAANYYDYYGNTSMYPTCDRFNFGVKVNYLTKNNHFELSTGLRHSYMNKCLDNYDFFYYLINTQDNIEYYRIKEISQRTGYIGIPVEIRMYPRDEIHFISQFFTIGTDWNLLISNKNDATFYNEAMQPYEKDIIETVNNPDHFFGSVNAGIGVRIGKKDGIAAVIQAMFPCLYVTSSKKFGLVDPFVGLAAQFELQIPIK